MARPMSTTRLDDDPPLSRRRRLRDLKNVPVLPSLITLGNVFFGFLAIAKIADAMRTSMPGSPLSSRLMRRTRPRFVLLPVALLPSPDHFGSLVILSAGLPAAGLVQASRACGPGGLL